MSRVKKNIAKAAAVGVSLLPYFAFAQESVPPPNTPAINRIISAVGGTLQLIIGVLFIIATLVFLWGMVMYITQSSDEQKREKAKGIMTWGIIGLAVMAVAWGITTILVSYFGVPSAAPVFRPPPIVIPTSG